MFFVGTLMGPLHHYYYVYLDKLMPRADAKTAIKKIMCDQAFASPATIIFFFYGMGLLEKKTLAQSTEELKEKFLYVYMVSGLQHLLPCFASKGTTIYLQFFFLYFMAFIFSVFEDLCTFGAILCDSFYISSRNHIL